MFDFAWSEIALIGVLALVLIGPKDLPIAMKAVSQTIKKARRMAGEFQTHVDEMMREADLHEVRDTFNDLRRMDIKGRILRAVDNDGSLQKTISTPLTDFSPPPPPVPVHDTAALPEVTVEPSADLAVSDPAIAVEAEPVDDAPAFVPPHYGGSRARRSAPAFIPPAAAMAAQNTSA
jgi:sec-independent protein translocase protein TatB